MNRDPAILVLADGTLLEGFSVGAKGQAVGELVFNTAMTGYQEMLTDPSYARQLITLTTAHVGNTGCNQMDMESSRVWASGLVVRDCLFIPSNYRSESGLPDWLRHHNIVAIAGVDTRYLAQRLREEGAMNACISTAPNEIDSALAKARSCPSLNGLDLASLVTRQAIERWDTGRGQWASHSQPMQHHVVVYDFGVKESILRILYDLGCYLTIVPATTPAIEVLNMEPHGVVLSNGPGDPQACDYAIRAAQAFLEARLPLLGICLGFQILGLACGARTMKMKFGHHGANHPVIEVGSKQRVAITSQNHGFCIDEASLPSCLKVTHRSLFDGSLQGIIHTERPALGVQGHPEASPGPHDSEAIFSQFNAMMQRASNDIHPKRQE